MCELKEVIKYSSKLKLLYVEDNTVTRKATMELWLNVLS